MPSIEEVLNRRADLSTFVVHLSRDHDGSTAAENLRSIIKTHRIEARSAMGWAQSGHFGTPPIEEIGHTPQRTVSFSETPLEHVYSLVANIPRQIELRPYGLAFTKITVRRRGANPVWYVDRSAGAAHGWVVAKAIDSLCRRALAEPEGEIAPEIGTILPFFDVMATWGADRQKEFWWEREWRHVGDFTFDLRHVALWLSPQEEHPDFEELLRSEWEAEGYPTVSTPVFVDPSWSLERIIAKLVRLGPGDVTPFAIREQAPAEDVAEAEAGLGLYPTPEDEVGEQEEWRQADPDDCPYRVAFVGALCPGCGHVHGGVDAGEVCPRCGRLHH
jgi:hypothetical protein